MRSTISVFLLILVFCSSTLPGSAMCNVLSAIYNSQLDPNISKDTVSSTEEPNTISYNSFKNKTVVIPDSILFRLKGNNGEVFGISDPYLDSLYSYNQALFRAFLIKSLAKSTVIKQVEDNFQHQNDDESRKAKGVFIEMYSVETTVPLPQTVKVNWSVRLSSGEQIVAIDTVDHPSDSVLSIIPVKILLFHKVNEAGSLYQLFRLKYCIKNIPFITGLFTFSDSLDFLWINRDKKQFAQVFCENHPSYTSSKFFYRKMSGYFRSGETTISGMSSPTIFGLWPALISGVIWQLPLQMQSDSLVIREVGDFYNSLSMRLNRTIQSSRVTFKIKAIHFLGGIVMVELNLPQLFEIKPQDAIPIE
ncbi:MAG: hypothetical protein LWX70_02170 [Sphingobacteriia bacterium]|nr:hypothetical protein [Sphingobacteriia bacterium]